MDFERPAFLPALSTALAFAAGAAITFMLAEAVQRMRLAQPGPVSDDLVLRRVQARVAEIVSEPGSVDVSVENGVVRLAGHIPPEERDQLLTQLLYMPGVVRLRNALGHAS